MSFPQNALVVVGGTVVTATLVVALEYTITSRHHGVASLEMMRLILVLDMFAAVLGGYFTAWIGVRSRLKNAAAVAGLFLSTVATLGLLQGEPLEQIAAKGLGLAVCIFLGAIGRDWQCLRFDGHAA